MTRKTSVSKQSVPVSTEDPTAPAPVIIPESEEREQVQTELKVPADNRISVVIPYVKAFAQGQELKFAMASFQNFLRDPFKLIVIGDSEDWFSEEVLHIPCDRISDNPQIDVLEKLKMAITSELVTEKFIWTNDDIYLVSPVTLADMEVLKVKGSLDPQSFSGMYRENMEQTIQLLKPFFTTWDFATHTPVVYTKEYWVRTFEYFPELLNGGYLLSSVYFNLCFGEHRPIMLDWKTDNCLLPVKTKNPEKSTYDQLVQMKKFMNNAESGYSEFLEARLKELFPDKSIFEK